MKENRISRREFAVAAAGALLCAATADAFDDNPFHALVRRCGALRLGCCSNGGIAPGDIEARHAEHMAFLLSLCDAKEIQAQYSAGGAAPQEGRGTLATLMSTLALDKGLRLEVVTTGAILAGPELSLRGGGGNLYVANGRVYFSPSTETMCPWRNEAYAQPEMCWKAFLASRQSINTRGYYAKTAREITTSAAARLC